MKILAVNTAGPVLEIAVYNKESRITKESVDIKYFRYDDNRKASVVLMSAIDKLLAEAEITPAELDYISCVVGPGSFTGIRIGICTVRALCYVTGKPAVGVNYLRMLAYNESADGCESILCVTDGSNGTAYVAEYDRKREEIVSCHCVTASEAVEMASRHVGAVCVDEHMAKLLPYAIAPENNCRSLIKASLAATENACGYNELIPYYVRQSQAEKDLKEKSCV